MDVLLSKDQIQNRVEELAKQIAQDFEDKPVTIVGILSGCVIFLADLIRQLDLPVRITFVQASSYRGGTTSGKLFIQPDLLPDLRGRDVILLDDILDTGQTMIKLTEQMHKLGAKSVRSLVLLRKIGRQTLDFEPDYFGFDIPDAFVVGYGLDYNDNYRQLPYIAALSESDLQADT